MDNFSNYIVCLPCLSNKKHFMRLFLYIKYILFSPAVQFYVSCIAETLTNLCLSKTLWHCPERWKLFTLLKYIYTQVHVYKAMELWSDDINLGTVLFLFIRSTPPFLCTFSSYSFNSFLILCHSGGNDCALYYSIG